MQDNNFDNKNDYENFLILPQIKNESLINVQENNFESEITRRINTNSVLNTEKDENNKSDASGKKPNLPKI